MLIMRAANGMVVQPLCMQVRKMAASIDGILPGKLASSVLNSKLLVVGAGGIGCELLKNLVLTGFRTIVVIDLDTIDVSNLNRQFLFQKKHVGKSKAQVAKESVLTFNPDVSIEARHDSIMNPEYNRDFFKQFTMVLNALDNRAARNHVNRMCLAADVPLVESGSAGYLGQVTVIRKGLTECYECQPAPPQKSFPGCTIRNTPSEPIHCIVWGKHLFNQLFGEDDPDQDVSPDTADPEAAGDAGQQAVDHIPTMDGNVIRESTKKWAQDSGFNAEKLFRKFFHEDIKYLLSMEKLWKKRRPPTPLDWNNLPDTEEVSNDKGNLLRDQRQWNIKDCVRVFDESLASLHIQSKDRGELAWDKDDQAAMDFVACTANIRSHIFGIPMKTRFDIKSMAGNIIPAIATTNAVIAGLIVIEALKVLANNMEKCKTVYMTRFPNSRKKLLVPCVLIPPNPNCYVCADRPEVTIKLNTNTTSIRMLQDKILKSALGMIAPDVEIQDGKGTILISSDEEETLENMPRMLSEFNIIGGSRLKADDFLQNFELVINIQYEETLEEEAEFEVVGKLPVVHKEAEAKSDQKDNQSTTQAESHDQVSSTNGNGDVAGPSQEGPNDVDDDDDFMILDDEEEVEEVVEEKKMEVSDDGDSRKQGPNDVDDDDDFMILDDEEEVEEVVEEKKMEVSDDGDSRKLST
ncbi:SUMO-activating enzyme subunit 2-like isoform X2 [Lytechinus pictus]|uniref:SUMO-activating enzyme subunit 2-like isoform X2 n=1 Tax=Lytechinus pictus TaxID=7653 RepID=UPI0030B9B3DC